METKECAGGVCSLGALKCEQCDKKIEDCTCHEDPVSHYLYQVAYTENDGSIEYYMCDRFETAIKFIIELLNADIDERMPLLHIKQECLDKIKEQKIFENRNEYSFNSFIKIKKVPLIVSELIDKKNEFYFENLLYFREYPKCEECKCCECESEEESCESDSECESD